VTLLTSSIFTSSSQKKKEKEKKNKERTLTSFIGSPGADRVVFNPAYQGSCVYVGAMTHTDAPTRNGFVECEEETGDDSDSDSGSGTTSSTRPSGTASGTGSGTSSAPTSTGTGEVEDNAAGSVVRGMGVQGLVVGLVAGLLWL
jgi:hypothetical protein